jgi:hypothetical protein
MNRSGYNKEYRKKNKESISDYGKEYRKKNKESLSVKKKEYRKKNKTKIYERNLEWRKANKDKVRVSANEYQKKRYHNDSLFRLQLILRARFRNFLKQNNCRKSGRSFEIFSATPKQIKSHIESQFKDDMTWENQGEWHIDHIIPLDYYAKNFDLNDLEVQKKAFNYKNLQPLWAFENLSKSNKFEKHTQSA